MDINELGAIAHNINAGNGWEVFHLEDWPDSNQLNVPKLCTHMALIHTEVSEATEAVRNRDASNFQEELADVVIRVASIAYGLGIDLDRAVREKMEFNTTRGLHHGGKAV